MTGPGSDRRPWRRRRLLALAAVLAAVVLVHAWITHRVMAHLQDIERGQTAQIERMEASFVADMQLTEPPVVAVPSATAAPDPAPFISDLPSPVASAASVPASRPALARDSAHVLAAASAPDSATPSDADIPQDASAPPEVAEAASAVLPDHARIAAASAPASGPDSSTGPAFEWPLATRVTFKLEGYVRGPVHGDAMVEWVRQDERYQVHVDASIGPRFAPLGSQRWTSEGVITPQGLRPRRFEAINKLLIASSTPKVVLFEDEVVVLADGKRLPRLPGVQDPASHYIQMAYEFILKPETLRTGSAVKIPLARTRHQEHIVYDIVGEELLDTPLGKVNTFRMIPRPLADQKSDLLGEVWIAPSLQYLPIRMLVRHGPQNYLDMRMSRAPQQSAARASAASEAATLPASAPPPAVRAKPPLSPLDQLAVPP